MEEGVQSFHAIFRCATFQGCTHVQLYRSSVTPCPGFMEAMLQMCGRSIDIMCRCDHTKGHDLTLKP